MGLGIGVSSSTYDRPKQYNQCLPNPDPCNYRIIDSIRMNGYLIVKLNYPDCTNFEGNKICVFKNCNLYTLLKQKSIDPHFSSNKNFISPIARFEPTQEGWNNAILFVDKVLLNEQS